VSAFIPYPDWICPDCGKLYGRGWPKGHVGTFHNGACDLCGVQAYVTEPRDYGHLRDGWRELLASAPPPSAARDEGRG
jgi:hypothetical protein